MNENLKLREYGNESKLKIDGRNIPYRLVTAADYLVAKNEGWNMEDVKQYKSVFPSQFIMLNQIMAIKQACVLLMHTSHSHHSLAKDLLALKRQLILELDAVGVEFDEKLVDRFTYNMKNEEVL